MATTTVLADKRDKRARRGIMSMIGKRRAGVTIPWPLLATGFGHADHDPVHSLLAIAPVVPKMPRENIRRTPRDRAEPAAGDQKRRALWGMGPVRCVKVLRLVRTSSGGWSQFRVLSCQGFAAILDAMSRWSARQIVVLLLAVFVAVGLGLSAVQAGDMTVKMAMASDMADSSHEDCQGCPMDGGDDGAMASCSLACTAPVSALLPKAPTVATTSAPRPRLAAYPVLSGRTARPDPYPPRSSDLA